MPHKVTNISAASTTVSAVDFSDAITLVTFTSDSTDTVWTPISGVTQTTTGVPVWTANIEFGQDLSANSTLTKFLVDNHGKTTTLVYKPNGGIGGTQTITANVTIKMPSTLGGGVGVATSTTTLPVNGALNITVGAS
ncbi:hypothetical protein FV140_14620 [Paenarthrobacter ureafaciens]|uniref:Uncharacterized protein n=1 Tax=Paenarthrobacter ureafaciens TaxID=37931 RepID=A0AAX3EEE1_PAEUR|nr:MULTISPECIES: hypothetical protein [Paenarthrobacter]MDO5876496.1 hypothetical protein [Paenarthrobacter sp. SD-1]QMU83193.1 hypothetical protein FV140_14620 [Paenarthrobacter ureafaciens]UYV96270.1 hypothetical protein NL394_14500 [Paenarthrobacter ureafaciens]